MTSEKDENNGMSEETLDKNINDLPGGTLEKAMRKELGFTSKEATQVARYYRKFKAEKLLNNSLQEVLEIIKVNDETGTASKEAIVDNDLLKP